MPKKMETEEVKFQMITGGGRGELFGLTEDGSVYSFDSKNGIWRPLKMVTPKLPAVSATVTRYSSSESKG